MRPSFLGFFANAIIMTIIIFLIILEIYKNKIDSITLIYLLAVLSVVLSLHTLHHYIEETVFHFNPLRGKWKVEDEI